MDLPLSGRCRCDRVRIRVTDFPLITMACHCPGCQRMAASAFSLTALYRASTFEVTQGEPVIGGLRGDDIRHYFCAHCMTWMFTRPTPLPDVVNVRPTMLDDHTWFQPYAETFTKTKLRWAKTGAVRSYEEFPPMDQFGSLVDEYAHAQR